jgi:hypothetical protein
LAQCRRLLVGRSDAVVAQPGFCRRRIANVTLVVVIFSDPDGNTWVLQEKGYRDG